MGTKPLHIAWLSVVDKAPASVWLPKKALAEAAERRGASALDKTDSASIRRVVCQTRLDETLHARYAADGKVRGVEVVEVAWDAPLKDTAQIRRVATWLGHALRLNPVAVAFIHPMGYCTEIRPALILPEKDGPKVTVGALTAHNGIVSTLPVFWTDAGLAATTALGWAHAAFSALHREERLDEIRERRAALNARLAKPTCSTSEAREIHQELKRFAEEEITLSRPGAFA